MRVVLTPKAPPSEPLSFTDIKTVVVGSGGHGEPNMDAVVLIFRGGSVVTNPLASYARIDVGEDA